MWSMRLLVVYVAVKLINLMSFPIFTTLFYIYIRTDRRFLPQKYWGVFVDKKLSPLTTFFMSYRVQCGPIRSIWILETWCSHSEILQWLTLIESHLIWLCITNGTRNNHHIGKKRVQETGSSYLCELDMNVLPYVTPAVIPQEINDYFTIILQSFCINCCKCAVQQSDIQQFFSF